MSKKIIMWVCIVLPIAFIGLMTMQVMWFVDAHSLREQQFDQAVAKSLDDVISTLEMEELGNDFFRKSHSTGPNPFIVGDNATGDGHKLGMLELDFAVGKFSSYTIGIRQEGRQIFSDSGKLPTGQSLTADVTLNTFILLNDLLTRRIRYETALRSRSSFEDRPIEARVSPQRVDALLMQNFSDNGISVDHEFAIFNSNGALAMSSHGYGYDEAEEDHKVYEKRLFPHDVHSRAHHLRVYFPNRDEAMGLSMGLIVPTILFFCLVLGISSYTVYIIFHQKKLDEMKNDFVGNMTHEFKTPISTISLSAQLLKSSAQSAKPESINRLTGIILDESKRLTVQVEKILQMSFFDTGRSAMRLKPMDVNEIAHRVANNFRIKVESENGELLEQYDAEDSTAMVDEVHFTNVIYNLLDNAFKYRSQDAPMMHIWTRNVKGGLVVSVKDNGLGISAENQKHIFDKFYRVSTGDRHDVKGFGLGLAYVKKVIDDHGGKISVESELNVGTRFEIFLPLK